MAFFVCVCVLLRILSQSPIRHRSCFSSQRINRLNNFRFIRNYSTVPQKETSGDNLVKLDPNFVTGLTEAEGSFSVTKRRDERAKYGLTIGLRFKITMLINELELLKQVQSFFGVGVLDVNNNTGVVDYVVRGNNELNVIKEHFLKYPLRGTKYLDFLDFVKVLDLKAQDVHRNKEGINLLVSISEGMNSYRKEFLVPVHTEKGNPEYIMINGHYINGFIAGDGSLYLRTKSNFGSMGVQISQHINNSHLMREIADFFNPALKISVHGKDSVQITLGGMKL